MTQQSVQQHSSMGPNHLPTVIGGVVLVGVLAFIIWGVVESLNPPKVPIEGFMDAKTVSVAAKVPGRIDVIDVREGDQITKDQVVAHLKLPELRAQLSSAQAAERAAQAKSDLAQIGPRAQQITAAQADLNRALAGQTLAQTSYDRIESLFKDGFVSAQRRDEVYAQLQNAKGQVKAAQAQLSALKEGVRLQDKEAAQALVAQAAGGVAASQSLVDEAQVKSPIAGEVTRIVFNEGEIAPAGFPLVLVTNLKDQWAVFNVREDLLKDLQVGQNIAVYIPALNQHTTFKIYWVNPRGDYATWRATRQTTGYDLRTFEVRARPTQAVPGLRPGMSVVIDASTSAS